MDRRTLTMNWDELVEEDDDDRFFESFDRISSAVPLDLVSSGSDDDEFEDSRLSFVSCISSKSYASINNFHDLDAVANSSPMLEDYGMWMAEPGDVKERRKRLLQGMGLSSNKNLLKIASAKIVGAITRKDGTGKVPTAKAETSPSSKDEPQQETPESTRILLVRSRSDGDIETFSVNTKKRKEELIGPISKQRLTRTSSVLITAHAGLYPYANPVKASPQRITCRSSNGGLLSSMFPEGGFGSFFLIKNLDTGKEFIVKEYNEEGMWNKLSDVQTGKQLTMEEFEKSVGYSPVVKELMRRENVSRNMDDDSKKMSANSYLSKSFRNSKRRGVALLKNIRGVANSMSGLIVDKEREHPSAHVDQKTSKNSSQWVKVRQTGKSYKEFTALHLCQEIQAHEGSIWTIKFSTDARYLASAGEDRVIHVWEVQECEVMSTRPSDDLNSVSSSPVHPMAATAAERPPLAEVTPLPSDRRKKGKHTSKKRGNSIPDYAHVPETVFALSEKPVCTFTGHLDDVLDLSWSRYQLLLSSSMDKTVRLWDMETKSCLKLFAHNDYVTCIDFNPLDDDYFISGSLDAKVRIWNVPDRQVVDWTDLHEMVTAACYTPDGQGAIIGSHKGSCRSYSIADYKLEQKDQIEFQNKKKSAKKVTGLQFAPWNPAELLVTSADSRIRILDGSDIIHKFRGFRNTSSQISAAFSPEGKYIISASEDNQVYIWKREDPTGKAKSRVTTQSHEHFQCRDVSVAIPWPGSVKHEPPQVEIHSKRNSKRSTVPSQSAAGSPTQEDNNGIANSRRHLPPLPKKKNNNNNNNVLERYESCADDNFANFSRIDSGIGTSESFASASPSIRYSDSPSISASSTFNSQSWSSSWSIFDSGSSNGGHTVQATAWGSVIVTATLGGEIRVYQNFGLPVKVGRQNNLFRDLT